MVRTKMGIDTIKEVFKTLPNPFAEGYKERVHRPPDIPDIRAYQAAYKIIEGVVREANCRVDAAAIAIMRDVLKAKTINILDINGKPVWPTLETVFGALEYAPPARARGQQL